MDLQSSENRLLFQCCFVLYNEQSGMLRCQSRQNIYRLVRLIATMVLVVVIMVIIRTNHSNNDDDSGNDNQDLHLTAFHDDNDIVDNIKYTIMFMLP